MLNIKSICRGQELKLGSPISVTIFIPVSAWSLLIHLKYVPLYFQTSLFYDYKIEIGKTTSKMMLCVIYRILASLYHKSILKRIHSQQHTHLSKLLRKEKKNVYIFAYIQYAYVCLSQQPNVFLSIHFANQRGLFSTLEVCF